MTETTAPALTVSPAALASLDERDQAYLREATAARAAMVEPLQGDVIRFADGTERRISHVWPDSIQSATGGSYHFARSGHMSYSGSLFVGVPADSLTLTDETAQVPAWFFHHGWAKAHNGVNVVATVRVWQSSADAPQH